FVGSASSSDEPTLPLPDQLKFRYFIAPSACIARRGHSCIFTARQNMRFIWKLLAAAVLPAITFRAAPRAEALRENSWTPSKIQTGSPCVFRVRMGVIPASLVGVWQGHSLTFVPSASQDAWYALAGVDVAAKPGVYKLLLQATLPNNRVLSEHRTV